MPPAVIEWDLLLEVIWVSLLAGIGVTGVFSVVIFASARAGEARRARRGGAATLYVGVTAVATLVFVGGVVLGVSVILNK